MARQDTKDPVSPLFIYIHTYIHSFSGESGFTDATEVPAADLLRRRLLGGLGGGLISVADALMMRSTSSALRPLTLRLSA